MCGGTKLLSAEASDTCSRGFSYLVSFCISSSYSKLVRIRILWFFLHLKAEHEFLPNGAFRAWGDSKIVWHISALMKNPF